jgi:serine protease SohB
LEFLTEYGVFLAKAVTIVVAILLIISALASAAMSAKDEDKGHVEVKHLNKKLERIKHVMLEHVLDEQALKAYDKVRKKEQKLQQKKADEKKPAEADKKRVFVLDFDGDIRASDNEQFRASITAVMSMAKAGVDEVVVRLESGGGMVHSYGLAAAQMDRIKSRGVSLTACVDKVAASGGYMMACVADKIIASPFAILGSIGVVAQIPNFHKLLKKNSIDFEVLTAGEHKRTLTVFGENTDKGREKFMSDLEDTHELFKGFVQEHRPSVDMTKVANGDVWFGKRAQEVNLVDELTTSDEYLLRCCDHAEVYEVKYIEKKSLPEKLGLAASTGVERGLDKLVTMAVNSRFMQ